MRAAHKTSEPAHSHALNSTNMNSLCLEGIKVLVQLHLGEQWLLHPASISSVCPGGLLLPSCCFPQQQHFNNAHIAKRITTTQRDRVIAFATLRQRTQHAPRDPRGLPSSSFNMRSKNDWSAGPTCVLCARRMRRSGKKKTGPKERS